MDRADSLILNFLNYKLSISDCPCPLASGGTKNVKIIESLGGILLYLWNYLDHYFSIGYGLI